MPSLSTPHERGFRMPAEWEPHRATWLAWPHARDWPGKAGAIPWVFAEMVRHLCPSERVRILVRDGAERERACHVLERARADTSRVDFLGIPTNRSWTRDFLPCFLTMQSRGRLPELGAVKWRFTGWHRYRNHRLDEAAGTEVAAWLGAKTFWPEAPNGLGRVVLEGGALDVDGEGTVIVSEECLLSGPFARCAELGRDVVEKLFADYLGAPRVLWVEGGIAGDDTSGHVDDFVRFVGGGRVILCDEPRGRDPNHRPLSAARERLRGARDARGRRLDVVSLPMPRPLYFRGDRLPASYANFYVANAVVLVPTFNDARDRVALGILGELFPERTVIGIHAVDLVLGLGTLHCSTQQEPLARSPRARNQSLVFSRS
jgi:agmatine deiminase